MIGWLLVLAALAMLVALLCVAIRRPQPTPAPPINIPSVTQARTIEPKRHGQGSRQRYRYRL